VTGGVSNPLPEILMAGHTADSGKFSAVDKMRSLILVQPRNRFWRTGNWAVAFFKIIPNREQTTTVQVTAVISFGESHS
jgi:hypothetical protein